jgi:hypothetical protein
MGKAGLEEEKAADALYFRTVINPAKGFWQQIYYL